jgi:hypothetical protein
LSFLFETEFPLESASHPMPPSELSQQWSYRI